MAHVSESQEVHKRKRDADDAGGQPAHSDRIPQPPPPPPQTGSPFIVNYMSKSGIRRIDLIPGDLDVFSDILGLLGNYEGVLSRHESLAANLGAKLTGPRLLRAMEGVFEGPIMTSPSSPFQYQYAPVSWLDIVTFARSNPEKFLLSANADGERSCHFCLNGTQVQILEDDWRLIVNGTLERFSMVSNAPLEEDEMAELATLDIVETRLQVLIKKADEVAKRARQLNYHLSGRKAAINARHANNSTSTGFRHFGSPHGQNGTGSGYDLRADLLQQFTALTAQSYAQRMPPVPGQDAGQALHNSYGTAENRNQLPMQPGRSPLPSAQPIPRSDTYDPTAAYRKVMTARVERLNKGSPIYPPCDRCRRLKAPCVKHLTACQGCTKKHAKCSWKTITNREMSWLDRVESDAMDMELHGRELGSGHIAGSRYDLAHDDNRQTTDESVGSPLAREEGSRPESRGSQLVLQDTSLAEVVEMGGPDGLPDIYAPVSPSTSRPWPADILHHEDQPIQTSDHALLSHMASVATAAADARELMLRRTSA